MITFAFLFLGLVLGPHDIELLVEGDVASVQLVLDGQTVGELTTEPWRMQIDFGPTLRPHKLEAIALDETGREIDTTRQLVNLPRERAEAALLLEGQDPQKPESARLVWQHVEYQTAEKTTFRFDGKELSLSGPDQVKLPAYDPAVLHSIEASIRFPDGVRYQAELNIGGQTIFGADTELTGVTVVIPDMELPELRSLEGRFRGGGEPLRVVGVERAPARVAMVVDQTALPALRKLGEFGGNLTDTQTALRPGEQLVFLFPEVKKVEGKGVPSRLFSITQTFTAEHGGSIPWILTRISSPDQEPSPYRRISDAVAVAGVQAAIGNRPRAVVLVLGTRSQDHSAYDVKEMRRFLKDLRVPLFVWWTGRPRTEVTSDNERQLTQKTPWGRADDISTFTRLMQATQKVRLELDSQLTVWIEGSHLPHTIELAEGVRGIKMAG
jgi:hypothetical protein